MSDANSTKVLLIDDEVDFVETLAKRLRRRGFFGHVFRFGFNGQHRKQIEQTGTVILTEMFLKKKRPAKHLAK